ncbi:hypothetical protein [Algoriphagus sp.]|uniref:glycosyl-4,4'-diaponeurosporenoate acyltransferase CrtO family protein n=1 Tax=Algoriphagus sp. TaxID=1872435 RepID=UPI0026028BBC|nr:hypothetical protein [Algoriphagus sp.]
MSLLFSISFSISMTFTSMIFGFLVNEKIKRMDFYPRITQWDLIKDERINQWIGVEVMKFLVTKTFWRNLNTKLKLVGKPSVQDLTSLKEEMTHAEISHWIGFLAVFLVSVGFLINQNYQIGLVLLLMNSIFNLYPSLLQQQNKRRINRIIGQVNSKK